MATNTALLFYSIADSYRAGLQEQQQEREQGRIREASKRQAAQEAADQHAQFMARYLNLEPGMKAGPTTVGVAISTENQEADKDVCEALADHFDTNGVQVLRSLFKPAFVSDGLAIEGFRAPESLSSKLKLTNSVEVLLLGREIVRYSSHPSLENVLTASMQLEILAVSLTGSAKSRNWNFTSAGTGFKEVDARAMAEERLIGQISSDTNMTLASLLPNAK